MNIDDPKLTAYALDALPTDEKEQCELEVVGDSELWREAELTAAFAEKLKTAFTTETNARLSAAHWREIFAEAGVEPPPVVPVPVENARRFPLWALPAAAGVMFGAVIASLAITWNDRPAAQADSSQKPLPSLRPVEHVDPAPEVSGVFKAPARTETPVRVVKAPPKIPRPTVPAVAALPISTQSVAARTEPVAEQPGVLGIPEVEEIEPSPLADEEPEMLASAEQPLVAEPRHSVQPSGVMPFFPTRNFPRTASTVSVPKPVATPAPSQVSQAPVATATVTLPAATVAALSKKPANSVLAFNTHAPGNAASPAKNANANKAGKSKVVTVADAGLADSEMEAQLNSLRFGTLGDVQKVLDYNPSIVGVVGSGMWTIGAGIPFSIPNRPDLLVDVVLDNDGLPLWVTPVDTQVIDISTPYSIPSQP